jgi:hypothetical protein
MNEDTDGGQQPGRPQRPGGRQRAGRLAAALVPAALAGTILLAACSGSPSAAPAASRGLPTVQMLDSFATCMRSRGVPNFYFPAPRPAPPTSIPARQSSCLRSKRAVKADHRPGQVTASR